MRMGLRDEILEQPAAAQRLLDAAPTAFAPISAAVGSRRPRFAVIAARGTSDNAGIYAQYLLAIRNGMLVALAAPSTITLYGARPNWPTRSSSASRSRVARRTSSRSSRRRGGRVRRRSR